MIFSNADVIRRVHADFVPVALKAALVNYPPDNDEGRLYREIGRSKILPQGICVVNSAGKVLDWVFMFDDDQSVLAFLDHAKKRFAQFPDAQQPVPTERYMKFPSEKLADIEDNGKVVPVVERHAEGESCPARPRIQQGTIIARVFGRALDEHGKPVIDTVRQENYVEDRFNVPVVMQEALAKALAAAGTERFKFADDLARELMSHAFMGELDVNPLGGHHGGKGLRAECTLWGQKVQSDGNGPVRVRIDGTSEAAAILPQGQNENGWQHEVKLAWEGVAEMKGNRMTRLLLVAGGTEKLERGKSKRENKQLESGNPPGGHAVFIDLDCGVRYGIIGEPVPPEEAGGADIVQAIPYEARRMLTEAFGPTFLVYYDKVQKDLELSDEQKQEIQKRLPDTVQDAVQLFEKLADKTAEEQEKERRLYRQKALDKLAVFLKETLQDEQLKRLRQLELQQEGAFALYARPELGKELKITDEQRKRFMAVVQEMQKKIEPLMKEAESGGNPQEIRPRILKIRKEHEDRIEAILSDAQQKQWQEIRGKPLDLDD